VTPAALAAIHAAAMTTSRSWSAAEFESLLDDRTAFLVTEAAGFALGRAITDEAELLTLAVAPDRQRAGLGTRLLAGFEAEARTRGAATAFLEVAEDNAPARALYDRAGWEEAGRRPAYYPRADATAAAALVLRKALT
jgi:[ribosomal protein S18]-alanine N-acetyltransferase